MPVKDALRFLTALKTDSDLRGRLYSRNTPGGVAQEITRSGYEFSDWEFFDAARTLLLRCRDSEEALEVKELEQLYKNLKGVL